MKILLAFLAGALADTCSPDWYYQNGRQYNYEVVTRNSLLFADKGISSNDRSGEETLEGSLQLSVVEDCVAQALYRGRQFSTSSAVVRFSGIHAGQIADVAFPEGQSLEDNNALKAILSALQVDEHGIRYHKKVVGEKTHNGYSDSIYQCDCECTECACEKECEKYVVTRRPKVSIMPADQRSNPVLESLFGKMALDTSLDTYMGDIFCTYEIKDAVPSRVECEQTVQNNEVSSIYSSISLSLESESSARGLFNGNVGPYQTIKMTATPSDSICTTDRIACLTTMFNSVVVSDSEAVLNQFLLRREIHTITEADLMSLLKSSTLTTNAVSYLFTELAICDSAACNSALTYLATSGTITVYPTVYRAVQLQEIPSQILVEMIIADLQRGELSVEKLNILHSAIHRGAAIDTATITKTLATIIGSSCTTVTEDFSFLGYFSTRKSTSEAEMVIALKIARDIMMHSGAVLSELLPNIQSCLSYTGPATIKENAIMTLAYYYSPNDLVANIPATSHEITAALIVSLWKTHSMTAVQMNELFSSVYDIINDKPHINRMILSLDNTMGVDTVKFEKVVPLMLPEFIEQIELFSGLRLEATVVQTGASVTIKSELKNGEGFRVIEGDIVINSMIDMMTYALSGYYSCPEELWERVLDTENSMITLVENVINMQFENVLSKGGLSSLQAYLKLGGVQFKLIGQEMDTDWIVSMIENIKMFMDTNKSSTTPSLTEIYTIFTTGIETQFFRVFDSRRSMTTGLVSGMQMTSTLAHITAIDYNGNILPHLSTLGDSGDIKLQPSISNGIIKETQLVSKILKKTATSTQMGHVSFSGELAYRKSSAGIAVSFTLAPTISPMTFHVWQYVDGDYSMKRHMETSVHSLLAANLIVKKCTHGTEVSLDREIKVAFSAVAVGSGYELDVNVGGLGKIKAGAYGTLQDGSLVVHVADMNTVSNAQIKTACTSWAECSVGVDMQLPNLEAISNLNVLNVRRNRLSINSYTALGRTTLLSIKGTIAETDASLEFVSAPTFPYGSVSCKQTLTKTKSKNGGELTCGLTYMDHFVELNFDQSRNGGEVALKAKTFAVVGVVNSAREFRLTYFEYPANLYTSAAEITPESLKSHEVIDIMATWPTMRSGDMKIMGALEYNQQTMAKSQIVLTNTAKHRAMLVIPSIDCKVSYDFTLEGMSISYVHAIQMNPRKLRRELSAIGIKMSLKSIEDLLDTRDLIVHKFDVQYPSNHACSAQLATPENSLVSRVWVGNHMICFSGHDQQVAMRARTSASWKFDFVSGLNMATRNIFWKLVSDPISTSIEGQWVADLSGSEKTLAVQTHIQASGKLLSEPIDAQVRVTNQISNTEISSVVSGMYQDQKFQYALAGELTTVTIAGVTTDALVLNIPQNDMNIIALHQVTVFYRTFIPIGLSVAQSSFVAEWIVEPELPVVYMSLKNTDAVLPLAESSLRVDNKGMQMKFYTTAPQATFDFDLVFGESLRTILKSNVIVMKVVPMSEAHQFSIDVNEVGTMKCELSGNAPFVSLIELGIDTNTKNFKVLDGISTSGKTRIIADRNGIKTDGMKIHQIIHIFGYDLSVDSQINTPKPDENTPTEEIFKWCNVVGDISYVWFELSKQHSTIGRLGSWVTVGTESKCQNTIASVGDHYHQVATTFNNNGVLQMRVKLPASYVTQEDIIIETDLASSPKKLSVSTPLGNIITTLAPQNLRCNIVARKINADVELTWSLGDVKTMTTALAGTIDGVSYDGSVMSVKIMNAGNFAWNTEVVNNGAKTFTSALTCSNGRTATFTLVDQSIGLNTALSADIADIMNFSVTGQTEFGGFSANSQFVGKEGIYSLESTVKGAQIIFVNFDLNALKLASTVDFTSLRIPFHVSLINSETKMSGSLVYSDKSASVEIIKPVRNIAQGQLLIELPTVLTIGLTGEINVRTFDHSYDFNGAVGGVGSLNLKHRFEGPYLIITEVTGEYIHRSSSMFSTPHTDNFAVGCNINGYRSIVLSADVAGLKFDHKTITKDAPMTITTETTLNTQNHNIILQGTFGVSTDTYDLMVLTTVNTFNAKVATKLGKAFNSAMLTYEQENFGEIALDWTLESAKVHANIPTMTVSADATASINPIALNANIQYAGNKLLVNGNARQSGVWIVKYNDSIELKMKLATIIESSLAFNDRKYNLDVATDKLLVKFACVDPFIGTHKMILTSTSLTLEADAPVIECRASLAASISPIEVLLSGIQSGKSYKVEISESKMLANINIDGQTFSISQDNTRVISALKIDNVITFNIQVAGAKIEANLVVPPLEVTSNVNIVLRPIEIEIDTKVSDRNYLVVLSESKMNGHIAVENVLDFTSSMTNNLVSAELVLPTQGKYIVRISTSSVNGLVQVTDATIGNLEMTITPSTGKIIVSSPIIGLEADVMVDMTSGYTIKASFANIVQLSSSMANSVITTDLTVPEQGKYFVQISTSTVNAVAKITDVTVGNMDMTITPTTAKLIISSPIIRLEADIVIDITNGYTVSGSLMDVDFTSVLSVPNKQFKTSIPKYGTFALEFVENRLINSMSVINMFEYALTINTNNGMVDLEGNIVTNFKLSLSALDLYNNAVFVYDAVMRHPSSQPALVSEYIIRFSNANGVVVDVTPGQVINIFVSANMNFKLMVADNTITITTKYFAYELKTVNDIKSSRMAMKAMINGVEVNGILQYTSPLVVELTAKTTTATYVAQYGNNKLILSVPAVCEVNLNMADTISGEIMIVNLGTIVINKMMVEEIMIYFPVYVPTMVDMTAKISGFEIAIAGAQVENGIEYTIACDLGAGMTLNVDGTTIGAIGSITDLLTYDISSKMNFAVGNSVITQGLSYTYQLTSGSMVAEMNVNTALVKALVSIQTDGLSVEKLALTNILLNTQVADVTILVNSGFSYTKASSFAIHQTHVKLNTQTVFLIGGGEEIPIEIDLAQMALKPHEHLVIKLGELRIESRYVNINSFFVKAEPYLFVQRKGRVLKMLANGAGYSIRSSTDVRSHSFSQDLSMSHESNVLLKGEHSVHLKKGQIHVDWRIMDNVIQVDGKMVEELTINVISPVFKLKSEIDTSKLDLNFVCAPVVVQAHLTDDLTSNYFKVLNGRTALLDAQINSMEKISVEINAPITNINLNVNGENIVMRTAISEVSFNVECGKYCQVASATLANGDQKLADMTFDMSTGAYEFTCRTPVGQAKIVVNPTGTSTLMAVYKNALQFKGQLNSQGLIEVSLQTALVQVFANHKRMSVACSKYGLKTIMIFGEHFTFELQPNEDISINFVGTVNQSSELNIHLYNLIEAKSVYQNSVLSTKIVAAGAVMESVIAPDAANISVVGDNVDFAGEMTRTGFNASIKAPSQLASSVSYDNKKMIVTVPTRIYTIVSKDGLLKITPSMRS